MSADVRRRLGWLTLTMLLMRGALAVTPAPPPTVPAMVPAMVPELQSNLPIDLKAASSELDRRDNRLRFREVMITQGTLKVTAATGEAARLDFNNERWEFRGDVTIENAGSRVFCDTAELLFVDHELRSARLNGTPARFEQERPPAKPVRGHATTIEYDLAGATVLLKGSAWLSDSANEVSGERIAYDLRREHVTADADGKGPVRMRIQPPARSPADKNQPAAPPAARPADRPAP